jgi:hypothetical protein
MPSSTQVLPKILTKVSLNIICRPLILKTSSSIISILVSDLRYYKISLRSLFKSFLIFFLKWSIDLIGG